MTTNIQRHFTDPGLGDAVTPGPLVAVAPSLLDFPPATLATYPAETVIAEKLEAIVRLGVANSRVKGSYDLHVLSHRMASSPEFIARAIHATFERRGARLPEGAQLRGHHRCAPRDAPLCRCQIR